MSPRQGKWWNEATHQWVYTDLSTVEVPESDEDILGTLKAELDASGQPTGAGAGTVKDTYYYDLLEVGDLSQFRPSISLPLRMSLTLDVFTLSYCIFVSTK